jgi:negative regulator of sigma-B (phosphoserine phosphatase)
VTVTIAFLSEPADGEIDSGDTVIVRQDPAAILIAVVDVLGHGTEAGRVARIADQYLGAAPITRARSLIQGLHDALRGTRGAAATICVLRGRELDACGVGNVEARIPGSRHQVVSTPGIIGARVGTLRETTGALNPGDRLVCWSDGISSRTDLAAVRLLEPAHACAHIMTSHRRRHDDASVVIADVDRDEWR